MLPRPPSGKVRGRSLLKDLSRGGSSRSERNETLMIEYTYLFACTTLSPVCLSVILSTRSLNSKPNLAQFVTRGYIGVG